MRKNINTFAQYLKENYVQPSSKSKSKEQFYSENNINGEDLSYLGKGDFGTAYSIIDENGDSDGRVLKITTSKNEFELAKQMENSEAPVILNAFAKIFKTDIVEDDYYIILEELDEDSDIEDLFYELQGFLDEEGLPIQYVGHLDLDEKELSDELLEFINDLDAIIRAYGYLGVEASDIRPENMGRDSSGKMKSFDVDDKQR